MYVEGEWVKQGKVGYIKISQCMSLLCNCSAAHVLLNVMLWTVTCGSLKTASPAIIHFTMRMLLFVSA